MKKLINKQEYRIILEVIMGIILSIIINFIMISIGYSHYYSLNLQEKAYFINEMGMPIYKIINGKGIPVITNMIFSGIIWSILIVIIIELIISIKGRMNNA